MTKFIKITSVFLLTLMFLFGVGAAAQGDRNYVVACVGDSLTFGTGSDNRETDSWPSVLARLSSSRLKTANFGVYGATVSQVEGKCYTDTPEYRESLNCGADVVLVMLGSNDTLYPFLGADFAGEYRNLLQSYLDTGARVIVLLPPNMYYEGFLSFLDEDIVKVRAVERQVAAELGLDVIDLTSLSEQLADCCVDGGHYNSEGYAAFAEYIYKNLRNIL